MRIVDYKTGKAPNFKYSKAMNQKIADEAMWQLVKNFRATASRNVYPRS